MYCIVTLDQAINQRFSKQDTPVKISRSSHVVDWKCVGVMKWYLQMPTWGSQSVGVSESLNLQSWRAPTAGLQLSTLQTRSRKVLCRGLENNTAWYGQVKKLGVFMTIYIRLPSSSSLRYLQRFNPFLRIKRPIYFL